MKEKLPVKLIYKYSLTVNHTSKVLTMNNIKTIATYIGLTVAMILLITVMMIQFLQAAFPKDPVMEARIPIMKERAEQRAEAITAMQDEWMAEYTKNK
ncbi:MAG: hypothetical protein ABF649_07445 [Bacillus sp. (in: firmicutes)]